MKWRTLLLTCALVFGIAGIAAAQTADTITPDPEATTALATSDSQISVSGEVVSSTNTQLVIDSDAGERMTFDLDPETSDVTSFTAGERVTVRYRSSSSGTVYQAASIAVEPPERLPATASSLPLIGLLGFLALGGAAALRVARS
jgi:hypothetical protein